jgi:26S proteasome regulatory subunit N2
MAYCATGNNKAIRRLLHVAVSDVNDDVRRAAVTALGFILLRNPDQVPRIVQLLSESYNPHVRYGATLALGISCAGTGSMDAIELLEPMTRDPVDFVRQGALISLAMILIQQTDATNSKVSTVRKLYEKIISDKHEDSMAKFGAVLSQGIIDAGGRNVTISLLSRTGHTNMPAIVGMAVFSQFWYWYPLTHFLSLAFTPTAIIGLNKNIQIPQFEYLSNAKPSLFAYPPATKPPTTTVVEKVATAVLSTTAKAKARAKKNEKGDLMDVVSFGMLDLRIYIVQLTNVYDGRIRKHQHQQQQQRLKRLPRLRKRRKQMRRSPRKRRKKPLKCLRTWLVLCLLNSSILHSSLIHDTFLSKRAQLVASSS